MASASISVDVLNPGQVFACLGLLELLNLHSDDACGGFDWSQSDRVTFHISSRSLDNPIRVVLESLASARIEALVPSQYDTRLLDTTWATASTPTFPGTSVDRKTLPIRLSDGRRPLYFDLTSWCPARKREFKLYSGQQSSYQIATSMLAAIQELWRSRKSELLDDPFGVITPLGGSSFKLDARKSWTAIDAGYSPDEENHRVESSPLVELLAAIGLEYARPRAADDRAHDDDLRYAIWSGLLPPILARPAIGAISVGCPQRFFKFTLQKAGQNKIVTFAEEELSP